MPENFDWWQANVDAAVKAADEAKAKRNGVTSPMQEAGLTVEEAGDALSKSLRNYAAVEGLGPEDREIIGAEEREIDVTKYGDKEPNKIVIRDRRVEDVAAALRAQNVGGASNLYTKWADLESESTKAYWREMARAAIEALDRFATKADEIIVNRGGQETVYRAVEWRP